MDTAGICMFYFLALYAEFKACFDNENDCRIFNYDKYYSDKEFRNALIKDTANLFLTLTVKLLVKTAREANKAANVNNWVRNQACEPQFFDALLEEINSDLELKNRYEDFINKYKI